jgi:phosphoribosylanthranilate isomerase
MGYHLRIKICGVTSESDARTAAALGADAVGLNFAPESPRRIDAQTALSILRALPPFCEAVGVFVNRPLKSIYQDLQQLGRLLTIQWHGQGRELADTFPFKLIAAFPVRDQGSLDEINRYLDMARGMGQPPAAILLDGHAAGQHGGTGQRAPWELLANFRPGVPVLLAGGLTPDNVEEAVALVRPWGVDVASGVEKNPGQKDSEKVRRFIKRARNAAYQVKSR